ncbi:MAG TPA: hypothetical protein VN048_04815, partial [Verrucomicrobiae bacterium]|nr:hypothetical protein [Verrucomicrobiae bacterium]
MFNVRNLCGNPECPEYALQGPITGSDLMKSSGKVRAVNSVQFTTKMIMKTYNRLVCALALSIGTVFSLIPNARATTLTYTNAHLEMMLCFRQVGTANPFDLEVNLGSVTNLIALPAGTTITNTSYNFLQLSNAMGSSVLDNTEFSVTAAAFAGDTTSLAVAIDTVWATIPRSDPATPNAPWTRESRTITGGAASTIYDIGNLATEYSGLHVSDPLVNNNPVVGIPPGSAYSCEGDLGPAGDLNGSYFIVENYAPSPFTTAIVSDFFMEVPKDFADPLNGNATTGNTDYLGYFTFT